MSLFKKTQHVEGVVCKHCRTVYDDVTNKMSGYCDGCGAHLWDTNLKEGTYSVKKQNATPCVVKVTSYCAGIYTTIEYVRDI